jgi:hypothetical protein
MSNLFQTPLSITSKARTSGTSSNFVVRINQTSKIEKISLESLQIPFTWYPINATNNAIRFNDGTQRDVTIPIGVYSSSNITTAIQKAMNDSPSALTFTVSYDDVSKKIIIAETGGPTVFLLQFNIPNSLGNIIGYGLNNFSVLDSYIAENLLNINRNNFYVNLFSKELTRFAGDTITADHINPMLRIPNVTTLWGGTIDMENLKSIVWDFNPSKTLVEIDIRLTDPFGDDLEFNGIDEVVCNFKLYSRI